MISSNDSGDSLDKIYATIEIPTTTTAITKESTVNTNKVVAEEELGAPDGKDSCTPVPRAHEKRIVKPAQNQKSPFVDYANKEVVSKYANEVYNRVCMYGGESKDDLNKEKIVDCGGFYIELRDLADSVKPCGWISNSTVEIALRVLSSELENQKKHVMPLRIATKLRSVSCINDRMVKKAFKMTPECRLDHKEQIMFGVLQDLTPDIKQFNGHYYLIVLNLKAERFEVMDSLGSKGNKGLVADYRAIIGSIKYMWAQNYADSKINIEKWKTEHISTPMQKTTYDCGYFMLKFIELWNGRKMIAALNPMDMPVIRKQLTLKWLSWVQNKIEWQELLF